jgi:hypothetical protein
MFSNKLLHAYQISVILATVSDCFNVLLLQQYFARDKKFEVHRYASRYRFLLFPCLGLSYCSKLNLRIYFLPRV